MTEKLIKIIKEAKADDVYIVVQQNEVTKKRKVIRGAKTTWKGDEKYLYVPKYRFCGTEEDITEAMKKMEISSYVTYTSNMTEGSANRLAYEQELKEYVTRSKSLKNGSVMSRSKFDEISNSLSRGLRIYKLPKEGTRFNYKHAKERYESLAEGEYLDVSDRHGEGKGSKRVTTHSAKKVQGLEKIRIVSDNVDSYRAELEAIGLWKSPMIDKACSTLVANLKNITSKSTPSNEIVPGIEL